MVLEMKFSKDLFAAKILAIDAGKEIMRIYASDAKAGSKVELKPDRSELTKADLASNSIILDGLKKTGYAVISEEEQTEAELPKDKMWVVDPLDGTMDFVRRTGEFAVMIGLLERRQPVLGVVHLPALGKTYYAEKGNGAHVESDGKVADLHTSSRSHLNEFRLINSKNHFTAKDAVFIRFLDNGTLVQKGSIGVKLAEMAEARAEFYWNFSGLSIWDMCAPQAILEEAGGQVFDFKGRPLDYSAPRLANGILATNGKCKEEVLKAVSDFLQKT
ncbi:Fructose-1,6-bisphosphatase/inositol-1-monophosphatase [Candidatus Burarchaeum australiense]|nr:Fructose-1,6-bisphosphatase/inositol-1-monophosphatase [Candidatus Burarchaeum australiense]